jgi:hypothetical protein
MTLQEGEEAFIFVIPFVLNCRVSAASAARRFLFRAPAFLFGGHIGIAAFSLQSNLHDHTGSTCRATAGLQLQSAALPVT